MPESCQSTFRKLHSPSHDEVSMVDTQLVGIYLSPSAIHVTAYDPDGTVLATDEAEINDQTTVAWERALREATPAFRPNGICSVASTSGTALLVDEYGEPVFPPQMYHESAPKRAQQLKDAVSEADFGAEIALSPTAPLAKILRLKESQPEKFADVHWILSPTTWLLYRLYYGSSTRWQDVETDWTNALKFGADIRPSIPEWYDGLFEAAGFSPSLFPAIRPPGSFIGSANSELAQRTGLENLRLFQGVTDGNAFTLATGCFEPGDFSITFGGTSVVKYVSETISEHEALYYHRHPLNGYLPGAAFDSGEALRWFFTKLLDTTPRQGLELAQSAPIGEEYEVLLEGNRGPLFNPQVASSILGIEYDRSLSTTDVHGRLARGLTSSIILAEWMYISLIEDHFNTSIERVRLMNDDAPSLNDSYDWWNTQRASVWNRPVLEMESRAIAGLLIPAALIASVYDSPEEANERLLRRRTVVTPDTEIVGMYEQRKRDYLQRWQEIADIYVGDPVR